MQSYWEVFSFIFIYFCIDLGCGEFYLGMFKKNDYLVARDIVFKDKTSYGYTYAKYGKVFPCPITYFSVAERLGVNQAPKVQIIRGGLQKKYIVVKMWTYNAPIAVTISVGCENKKNKVHRSSQKLSEFTKAKSGIYIGPSGKTVVLKGISNVPSEIKNILSGTFGVSETADIPSSTTGLPSETTDTTTESTEVPRETTEIS